MKTLNYKGVQLIHSFVHLSTTPYFLPPLSSPFHNSSKKTKNKEEQGEEMKHLSSHSTHLHNLFPYFLIFGFGVAFGIIATSCLKNSPYSFQLNQFFVPDDFNHSIPTDKPLSPPHTEEMAANKSRVEAVAEEKKAEVEDEVNVMHEMDDKELFWRASMVPRIKQYPFHFTPKLAFMFLSRGNLPMSPFWELFFRGNHGFFSVYVHAHPSFKEQLPKESVFYGRNVPTKEVKWGEFSMVEAERRLLANALLDISNQRFILLSESCIPLFNFTTIYNYLIGSTHSFVESYDSPSSVCRGRYNPEMSPVVKVQQWRKGSQWFEMDRFLAVEVISDHIYAPLFKKFCRPACYSDEHYIPTLVSIKHKERNSNRTLTWVDWSKVGPHPGRLSRSNVTEEFMNQMRFGRQCEYNGESVNICFLFARKVMPDALWRLMTLGPRIMGFFDPLGGTTLST